MIFLLALVLAATLVTPGDAMTHIDADCVWNFHHNTADDFAEGEVFEISCASHCTNNGVTWGCHDEWFTSDSRVCVACAQAGSPDGCTIVMSGEKPEFTSCEANGITSYEWGGSFSSYMISGSQNSATESTSEYTLYDCGSGSGLQDVLFDTEQVVGLNSEGNTKCYATTTDSLNDFSSYEVTVDVYLPSTCAPNVGACHPGIIFNYVDGQNYDLVYLRSHASTGVSNCVQRMSIVGGSQQNLGTQACYGGSSAVPLETWFSMKLSVASSGHVTFSLSLTVGGDWNHEFVYEFTDHAVVGKAAIMSANYGDIDRMNYFRNFQVRDTATTEPTSEPTLPPSPEPTYPPSLEPTSPPTSPPSLEPTHKPTDAPTHVLGCTYESALNYNVAATQDDHSCVFEDCAFAEIAGCTYSHAANFDPLAIIDDGSCTFDVQGCMDPRAENYDAAATIDDGSCSYPSYRYFRWTPIELRGCHSANCGCWFEIAEFRMFNMDGSLISWDDISENAGGCRGDNAVAKAFDGSIGGNMWASGRWNPQDVCLTSDRGCVYALMEKVSGIAVGSYEWVSGTKRNSDPISWTLEARNNENDPWVLLDEMTDYDETITNKMTIGPFILDGF